MAKGVGNGSGQSRANKNKQIRQEALREQLQAHGHLQHVVELLNESSNLQLSEESDFILKRNMQIVDRKLKLINKYCPDLQSMQINADVETKTILIDLSGEGQEEPEEAK